MKTAHTSRRLTTLAVLGACAAAAALSGCRGDREDKPPRQFFPDMDDSPKFKPQRDAPFFADNRSMRPAVPGAVAFARVAFDPAAHARDDWAQPFLTERTMLLRDDPGFFEGMDEKGEFLNKIPVPVTRQLILRGQERFNIYCSACHGFTGNGQGMVGRRWLSAVANFHDPKYSDPAQRTGKDGYIFHTIRYGVPEATPEMFPKMPPYGPSINEADAWAVVAYVRVLQQSEVAIDQVPGPEREALTTQRDAYRAANPPPPAPPPAAGGEPGDAKPPAGGGSAK